MPKTSDLKPFPFLEMNKWFTIESYKYINPRNLKTWTEFIIGFPRAYVYWMWMMYKEHKEWTNGRRHKVV